MESQYFLTVERCQNGHRGIFCDKKGGAFISQTQHTDLEMDEILGIFSIVLNPKSEAFTEDELKGFSRFVPLGEYSMKYGIALKPNKEEEQIAKENFIHKGGGNDPETAKEDS